MNSDWLLEQKKWLEINQDLNDKLVAISSTKIGGELRGDVGGEYRDNVGEVRGERGEGRGEVRLRADRHALQSQSSPVITDKEKVCGVVWSF